MPINLIIHYILAQFLDISQNSTFSSSKYYVLSHFKYDEQAS